MRKLTPVDYLKPIRGQLSITKELEYGTAAIYDLCNALAETLAPEQSEKLTALIALFEKQLIKEADFFFTTGVGRGIAAKF